MDPEQTHPLRPLTVFVVVPVHDNARTVRRIVQGALAQGLHGLVVDDGSRDGSAQAVIGYGMKRLAQVPSVLAHSPLWGANPTSDAMTTVAAGSSVCFPESLSALSCDHPGEVAAITLQAPAKAGNPPTRGVR